LLLQSPADRSTAFGTRRQCSAKRQGEPDYLLIGRTLDNMLHVLERPNSDSDSQRKVSVQSKGEPFDEINHFFVK
jgi:hypothetical protein